MEYAVVTPWLPRRARPATMLAVAVHDPTDGELISRAADGDRAEDAVQETFASIWRAAGSYRPERGPGAPWLYAVARNAITDRGRARTEPPAEVPETIAGDPGPEERAEAGW